MVSMRHAIPQFHLTNSALWILHQLRQEFQYSTKRHLTIHNCCLKTNPISVLILSYVFDSNTHEKTSSNLYSYKQNSITRKCHDRFSSAAAKSCIFLCWIEIWQIEHALFCHILRILSKWSNNIISPQITQKTKI